jgi:hypothetical protein
MTSWFCPHQRRLQPVPSQPKKPPQSSCFRMINCLLRTGCCSSLRWIVPGCCTGKFYSLRKGFRDRQVRDRSIGDGALSNCHRAGKGVGSQQLSVCVSVHRFESGELTVPVILARGGSPMLLLIDNLNE